MLHEFTSVHKIFLVRWLTTNKHSTESIQYFAYWAKCTVENGTFFLKNDYPLFSLCFFLDLKLCQSIKGQLWIVCSRLHLSSNSWIVSLLVITPLNCTWKTRIEALLLKRHICLCHGDSVHQMQISQGSSSTK